MVKNYGSFINPFYVKLRVDSLSNGHAIWRDSVLISSMTIGSETLLVFNTWTAPTGSYTLKCSTAMFSDTTSSKQRQEHHPVCSVLASGEERPDRLPQ